MDAVPPSPCEHHLDQLIFAPPVNERKNLNPKLDNKAKSMYPSHRSRGSSPPPAPERSPDTRSRRDRRREGIPACPSEL
jgi:hypothetical protein